MTLDDRLTTAQMQSVALYLKQQELEGQRQQIVTQQQATNIELVRLDGVIETLTLLRKEAASGQ